MAADELREKPITVMCEPSLRDRAEKVASDMDRSLSWVGNRALEEFVEKHEKKGKR